MRARRTAAVAVLGGALLAAGIAGPAVKADPGAPGLPTGAGAAGTLADAAPTPASLAAEQLLRATAGAPLTLIRDARGLAHLLGTTAGHPLPLPLGTAPGAGAETLARAHLARVAPLFGLLDPVTELRGVPDPAGLEGSDGTDTILRFQQLRWGVPVLGGDLSVVLDSAGALKSVLGETLPTALGPAPAAAVTADQARRTALDLVARNHPGATHAALQASTPERWYLDPALIGVPAAEHMAAGPVWRTEVSDHGAVREMVLVDARTGQVPLHLDLVTEATAATQGICDRANKPDKDPYGSDCTSPYARTNTTTSSSSSVDKAEVGIAYDNTQRTWKFFKDNFNVDLTTLLGVDTGDGKKLRSTVRFCPETTLCSTANGTAFDNAFWNGRGMYYGAGWATADDIVAHELTHGVTEKTSRLLYLYQSGAINEAMSDIFGELVDLTDNYDGSGLQTDWFMGEDAPLDVLPLRNMANPTLTLPDPQPDRMRSPLYVVDFLFRDSGGVHDNSGVANKAGYLIAKGTAGELGGSFNGQTFPGVGLPKTAKLFYRVERILSSGADFADLGAALNQACSDLIGSYGFAQSTCDTVRKTVVATEMGDQPTGLAAAAAAPEAQFCPAGYGRGSILTDGFESFSSKRWGLGGFWARIGDYARTGLYSVYGVEPDYATSSSITLNPTQRIPHGVKTYLRFAHQYRLDSGPELTSGPYYDGARLEIRLPGGSWQSASGRSWQNGPTKTINPTGSGSTDTYKAFGGDSRGYGSSRVDLTSLAGKSVQLRWRLISDRQTSVDGWTLDDVALFACGGATPADVRTISVTRGSKRLTLKWTAPVWGGTGGVTAYRVKVSGRSAVTVSKSARSKVFTGLKPGKRYTVTVRPLAKGGDGPARSVSGTPKS